MAKRKPKKKKDEESEKDSKGLSQEELIHSICRKVEGAELLDKQTILEQGFINTNNLALNFICSERFIDGGIPRGRITEIFGPSSSAKTVVGTHILQGCQSIGGIGVLLDSESAYSPSFAETLGIESEKLIYMQPDFLEACFAKTQEIAGLVSSKGNKQPVCVVYDSIAASPSETEFNDMMEGKASGHEMGERARVCSKELRKISSLLNRQNCSFVIINQIRMKIGVMFGNPETTAGGGNSLEYYCSIRLDCRKGKVILDSRKRPIGVKVNVKCVKNKVTPPFKKAVGLRLYWNYGIDPCSGLLELLIDDDRIEKGSPGWYHIKGDTSKKFQAKKDENYVKPEFLLENPEVIDATREQVEAFLNWNSSAINATANEALETKVDEEGNQIDPDTGEILELNEEDSED